MSQLPIGQEVQPVHESPVTPKVELLLQTKRKTYK